jgi:hypothetical protein
VEPVELVACLAYLAFVVPDLALVVVLPLVVVVVVHPFFVDSYRVVLAFHLDFHPYVVAVSCACLDLCCHIVLDLCCFGDKVFVLDGVILFFHLSQIFW